MPINSQASRSDLFFAIGGTLPTDAPSYLKRQADEELTAALIAGTYTFVLDSRQKGKSSLIGRVIGALNARGIRTAKLDLQRFGSNVTIEQWYAALLNAVASQLGCKDEAFQYWSQHQDLGPMARWVGFLEQTLQGTTAPIVIFVDEVD